MRISRDQLACQQDGLCLMVMYGFAFLIESQMRGLRVHLFGRKLATTRSNIGSLKPPNRDSMGQSRDTDILNQSAPKERRRRRAEKRLSKSVFLESPFLLCPLKVFRTNT